MDWPNIPASVARRWGLAAALLWAMPALAAQPSFRQLCEQRLPPPSLRVQHADQGYRIDTRLSYRDLTSMMGAGLILHGKKSVLGLTQAETAAKVEIKMAHLRDAATGQECSSPQVVVSLEYKPIKVYVGREFAPGSCAYREILLHELRHVRAYESHLLRVEAAVRRRLGERFPRSIDYGDPHIAEERLTAQVYDDWLPLVDAEIRKVDAVQARIDTASEYDRMENVCNGEVHQLLGQAGEPDPD